MVDQVALEFAALPALFLEHNVDIPVGHRQDRFWAAFGSGTAYLPLLMADSGHTIATGTTNLQQNIRNMVNVELQRPPQAEVEAWATRTGNAVKVWARVTNRLSSPLSSAANGATVHALVWTEQRIGVTARYVLAAPSAGVDAPLAPGSSADFSLLSPSVAPADWTKVHTVVLVDYRPSGASGAFDMLQAAAAAAPALTLGATTMALRSDPADPAQASATVTLSGPPAVNWTATPATDWVEVQPSSGTLPATVTVRLVRDRLPAGEAVTTVAFAGAGDGLALTAQLTVHGERAEALRSVRRRLHRVGE